MSEWETGLFLGEDGKALPECLGALFYKRVCASPASQALVAMGQRLDYQTLWEQACSTAAALQDYGLAPGERVVIWAPKSIEMVASLLGVWLAGGVNVVANPVLKAAQVAHLVADSGARLVLTQAARATSLSFEPPEHVLTVQVLTMPVLTKLATSSAAGAGFKPVWRKPNDLAALLYTSGSTGAPKGVMLSHQNLILGAESVRRYLQLTARERILCVLPFGFDYGLNQLLSCWHTGACAVLTEYLLPRDVLRMIVAERITGLAGVPPLWLQLTALKWPAESALHLRYITNSGGRLPLPTVQKLQTLLPQTKIHLMYGLTEAFRSTSLDPARVGSKPESVGNAIPFARIDVVRADGTPCAVDEPGELVHSGPLVAQGYWQDSARTAERFRQAPQFIANEGRAGSPFAVWPTSVWPIAVWSGDRVVRDAEGDIRFLGRLDDMIKSSGYRISPTEIEEALYATGLVHEGVALGVEDEALGQAIGVVATPLKTDGVVRLATVLAPVLNPTQMLLAKLKAHVPNYQVPKYVVWVDEIPRTSSGKLDRVWAKAYMTQHLAPDVEETRC